MPDSAPLAATAPARTHGPAAPRRVASVWLPRLAAERALRRLGGDAGGAPFTVVAPAKGALRLASLCPLAEASGLRAGMGLTDARAIRPDLRAVPADPPAEAGFLRALARWAVRYSPWVGEDGVDGLALDVTGCAHLFGGEGPMLADIVSRLAERGLTACAAVADARGAAWALARFAASQAPVVAPRGGAREALAALPLAALRLEPEALAALGRLGLRRVDELARLPRGALARRAGLDVARRLDQAFGAEPEPVRAAPQGPGYAVRLRLPEPVGRVEDVAAGLDRLLARLCERLAERGMGARRLRLALRRVDGADVSLDVGLARPSREAGAIAALFARPLGEADAGFGVDALRLEATVVEPLSATQHRGPLAAPQARDAVERGEDAAFAALLGRLGNRLGFDRLTRPLPAESHIPARAFTTASAAFAAPHAGDWPAPPGLRPIALLRPEPGEATRRSGRPVSLRWRRRAHRLAVAIGPERIAPEWWLDDPAWRDGPRDYWRVETEDGLRLWLFCAPAAPGGPIWRVEGLFG
ncbi:Y-family DNA polymerase [Rubrimonas cliftonensis]|uniref:DNA-directed DNA polymerase n=1 Tax=Rubrimonas cliftonensis TaxID=89524 RepID=A0A1H3YFZ6_9RHOB|nr:DNA polymerase Y family protein [Rubrimonas cliftonensis]SEA10520.1 protein ImuB [Rubrimonas cliftonensis]